jgi:hypothetical protein
MQVKNKAQLQGLQKRVLVTCLSATWLRATENSTPLTGQADTHKLMQQ